MSITNKVEFLGVKLLYKPIAPAGFVAEVTLRAKPISVVLIIVIVPKYLNFQ